MKIKTIHGMIEFRMQRWRVSGGSQEVTYFDLSGELRAGYVSERLKEVSAYYSNRMSYGEVAGLVERLSGVRQLSDQGIQELVIERAQVASRRLEAARSELEAQGVRMPLVKGEVDVYAAGEPEVAIFDDAIEVREQKAHRESNRAAAAEPVSKKWVSTDVVMIGLASHKYEYVTATLGAGGKPGHPVEAGVVASLKREYGGGSASDPPPEPLNLVVLSDGAQAIRCRWMTLFGVVTIILDWYHLRKKVRELMSMIARTKPEKATHLREVLFHLWRGNPAAAIQYLKTQVAVRNSIKHQELIGYLEKHQAEIIDYGRRQKAGKPIGSGRGEKGVDQVIGRRQKKKGMSWSQTGSHALGILKVMELNGQWQQLWTPEKVAA